MRTLNKITGMLVVFALTHALVSVAAPTTDLKLMSKQFFEAHELFWNESPPPSIYAPDLERLLSLNSKCVTEGQSCAIDWDFWTSSQDRGEINFGMVNNVTNVGNLSEVEISYSCDCGPGKITKLTARIVFVKIDGIWLIQDVRRGKHSARAILASYFTNK